jgi:hypothetical protein
MTKTLTNAALAALLLCSAAAQAATFSLSGITDFGPLSGTAFSGLFSYSDIGLPTDGETPLTGFTLSFAGQSYTLASATDTPTAVFADGSFVGLSYVDDASTDTALRPQVSFTPGFFGLSDAHFDYIGSGDPDSGFGSYSVSAVPEPATLALWLGGLTLLLGAARARRR